MRNYNHYLRFIRNGVKVVFLESKFKTEKGENISYGLYGIEWNIDLLKYTHYDYFEMEGNYYYCELCENIDKTGMSYSHFELYKAVKDGAKYKKIGDKIYYTDPIPLIANSAWLAAYISKWIRELTGYNTIFYNQVYNSIILDDHSDLYNKKSNLL